MIDPSLAPRRTLSARNSVRSVGNPLRRVDNELMLGFQARFAVDRLSCPGAIGCVARNPAFVRRLWFAVRASTDVVPRKSASSRDMGARVTPTSASFRPIGSLHRCKPPRRDMRRRAPMELRDGPAAARLRPVGIALVARRRALDRAAKAMSGRAGARCRVNRARRARRIFARASAEGVARATERCEIPRRHRLRASARGPHANYL